MGSSKYYFNSTKQFGHWPIKLDTKTFFPLLTITQNKSNTTLFGKEYKILEMYNRKNSCLVCSWISAPIALVKSMEPNQLVFVSTSRFVEYHLVDLVQRKLSTTYYKINFEHFNPL